MAYRGKKLKPKSHHLRPKKNILKMPVFWITLLALVILATAGYFFFFYEKIQVSRIEILGNDDIAVEEIENMVWPEIEHKIALGTMKIASKTIFMVSPKKIVKDVLQTFPGIEELSVDKDMPNGLTLTIKERKPFAVFCLSEELSENNRCFFVDLHGIIFKPSDNNQQNMIVLHKEQKDQPEKVELGKEVVDKNIVEVVSKVQKSLQDNFQIDVRDVLVSNPLVFTTQENWKMYFDPTQDVALQIVKMNTLLKNEISESDRKNIQYIYLQYKDRAYYK